MTKHPLFRLMCVLFVIGSPALVALLAVSFGLISHEQFMELFQ